MTLEQELVNEMLHLYKNAKIKCSYNATRFIQMFYDKEAWQTAAALIKLKHSDRRFYSNVGM